MFVSVGLDLLLAEPTQVLVEIRFRDVGYLR